MYKLLYFTISFLGFLSLKAQQNQLPHDYFIIPLEIDLKLSGTFGELRSNHFHSGIDIKTNQRQGASVHASANGYVSRIKIQRYGYGKALYITHPNGYVTVYAHLQKFAPRIEDYVKKAQYKKEDYEIQLFPGDLDLRVDQGEIVAYSGNSGGSGGPHLHFEIRDAAAHPMNPFLFNIEVPDNKPPLVKTMMAYPMDENSTINGVSEPTHVRLIPTKDGNYKTESIAAYGLIGIGVNTSDQLDGASNHNGVYKISTRLNGRTNFEIVFDKFAFSETRHLNQLIDYQFFKEKRSRITKLFVPNQSPLSLYQNTENKGFIQLIEPGQTNNYFIEISDFKGNTRTIVMDIDNEQPLEERILPSTEGLTYVPHLQTYTHTLGSFTLSIPKNTLYKDALLDISQNLDTLKVHEDIIPLHKNMVITFDTSGKTYENLDQYFIARLGWGNKPNYVSTKKSGSKLTAYTRTLGTYTLAKDDTPPQVRAVNFNNKQWISNHSQLKVKITDDLSGIDGYRATINDQFIMMEYDYKTNLLVYDFDDNIVNDSENNLKIIVVDNVGNSTTFETQFFRKSKS